MRLGLWLPGWVLLTLWVQTAVAQDPFAAQVRPTDPLTPEQERAGFRLPPGFEIELVAAEPQILKPMNLAFDARGRLWVSQSTEYPFAVPEGRTGRDRISVLEDTDGDGRMDRVTTFVDGLNIPIGLYPYRDGVVAFSIPYIWYFEDTDGDGRADRRIKLYGPMGFERDTHGLNNGFRRGFDGWLYCCHGFNNETRVAGRDGHAIHMHSGNTYRIRLDGSRIEHYTWGQVNPFGMAMDPAGRLFTADCHSKPLTELLRGGYYPSFGKPHDGLGFVPPMMEHSHGSTAIAGVACYAAESFPPEYRGNLFTGNVMTSRVNRDSLEVRGSTLIAHEEPDFVIAADPWFRPVDIRLGPDGALYVADFYNRIIGHYEVPLNHPGRDRFRGRIWRIVYRGEKPGEKPARASDLTRRTVDELVGALADSNLMVRRLAMQHLVDHHGKQALGAVRQAFDASPGSVLRTHAVWVLERLEGLSDAALIEAARDPLRDVRVQAMRILSERPQWAAAQRKLAIDGLNDADALVRRAAADALGQHPHDTHLRPLLDALRKVDGADTHLRHTVRMALRNTLRDPSRFDALAAEELDPVDAEAIADICLALPHSRAASWLLGYLEKRPDEGASFAARVNHVARYVPAEDVGRLARLVEVRFGPNVDRQRELLFVVLDAQRRRGGAFPDSLVEWGRRVVDRLVASVSESDTAWRYIPYGANASAANPWGIEERVLAGENRRAKLLSTLPRGEQVTGILQSRPFALPDSLTLYVAGHDGPPNRPAAGRNLVRLRDAETGRILAESPAPRSDVAQKVTWNLKTQRGRRAVLELVDGHTGRGYAWIAAGGFEPPVVGVPSEPPFLVSERLQAVGRLIAELKLSDMTSHLRKLVSSDDLDLPSRESLARSLVALEGDVRRRALVPVVGSPDVTESLRRRVVTVIASPGAPRTDVEKVLEDAFRSAPGPLQERMAEALVSSREGGEILLGAMEKGIAAPALLRSERLRQRLLTVLRDASPRVDQLLARLPSRSEEIDRLLVQRRNGFLQHGGSAELGAAVFEKHCAACHRIGKKGNTIGPQLDGVGQRGLERILEDILDPHRNVDVAFRTTTVVLESGQVRTGLFRREDGAVLVFADEKGNEFTVPTKQIAERVPSRLSLMPENLAKTIPEDDFRHLLAFLVSQKSTAKPEDAAGGSSTGSAGGK